MKRFWMALLTAGLALAMAAPAAAAKPDRGPGGKPNDPEPPPCTNVITLDGIKGAIEYHCVWSPVDVDPRPDFGSVTVRVTKGQLNGLSVIVTDSYPGYLCLFQQEWFDENTGESLMPLGPGASATAEVPLVFGGESYWDSPVNWCSRFDPYGPKEDLNGEPLHLRLQLDTERGKNGGASVTITLNP